MHAKSLREEKEVECAMSYVKNEDKILGSTKL